VCEESIPGLRVDHVDISELPLLNTDLETPDGGFPPAVEAFRDRVRSADCFLFGSPEYNYSIASTCSPAPLPPQFQSRSPKSSVPEAVYVAPNSVLHLHETNCHG
jgi:hypothetical protein